MKRLLIFAFIFIFSILTAAKCFASFKIITEDEIFLTLYETKKVPYYISDDGIKITWTVEDGQIASITKKGTLKGLSVGKTTVTLAAGEISDSCTVYIKEPLPDLEISYQSGTVFGFEPSGEYLINGIIHTADSNGKIPIENEWLGKTIEIIKTNATKKCYSDSVFFHIEHTHNFLFFSTVSSTCTLCGYTVYKCICGEILKDDFQNPSGHKLSDFSYDGDRHYRKCLNENCDYTEADFHNFDNGCDGICNTCGFERETVHLFDNLCDTECNICNFSRTVTHKFENDCDDTCIICGFKRAVSHTFDNDCDAECNLCGFTRTVGHIFENDCDKVCNICGLRRITEHIYDGPCGEICTVCGYKRTVTHKFGKTYSKDDTSHFLKCKLCNNIFYRENHIFDNQCDTKCNVCKYRRAAIHDISESYSYNRRSHYNICNICLKSFNKERHIFTDTSDSTCDVCGYIRKIKVKSNSSKTANKSGKEVKNNGKSFKEIRNGIYKKRIIFFWAFSGTGLAIILMIIIMKFKEHKNPRT